MGKPKRREVITCGFDAGWNMSILAWEQWEKERPARWIECAPHEVPVVICSNCEESGKFSSYEACPNCGRRVVQDGEA